MLPVQLKSAESTVILVTESDVGSSHIAISTSKHEVVKVANVSPAEKVFPATQDITVFPCGSIKLSPISFVKFVVLLAII